MTRTWLLTSTTYATWLPGDARGFVSPVPNPPGPRVIHNQFGTPYDRDMPAPKDAARRSLKGPPIYPTPEQAEAVSDQLRKTAAYRSWEIHALAVMANHFHVVISASDEVHSTAIFRDLKSYAARALNLRWGKPVSGTWWTESGSRRPVCDERAIEDASNYVLHRQPNALAVWAGQGAHAPAQNPIPERPASNPIPERPASAG
jgi:REP element-mobilizing transposase RayT